MEVFGRAADYDTNIDPIVRVTAAEIRKRIEQYYQDPKHSQEIRLFLPAGSYAPQFSWPGHPGGLPAAPTDIASLPLAAAPGGDSTVSVPPQVKSNFLARRKSTVAVMLLALLAASAMIWYFARPPVLKQFWEPFVKSPEPVLFCIADQSQYSTIILRDAADPQREVTLKDSMVTIIIDDVSPLVNMAGLLRTFGKTYRVQGESSTSLTDLRHGPSVFIGAYDNGVDTAAYFASAISLCERS